MLTITLFVSALLGAPTPAGASNAHTFAAPGASSSSVLVRYEAPAQISLGEPLIVEFIVENYGEEAARVDLGFDRVENFVATLIDPAGRPTTTALLKPKLPDRLGRGGRTVVQPSLPFSHRLVLNEWFRFDRTGTYVLELRLKSAITTETGVRIDAPTTGTVVVEVGPRNQAVLEALCERLARTINTAHVEHFLEAAHVLSYVTDPVGVSCVGAVLERTDKVDHILIPGLARNGGPEALQMLNRLQKGSDPIRASLASSALYLETRRRR